jgi:hypothetical protein
MKRAIDHFIREAKTRLAAKELWDVDENQD